MPNQPKPCPVEFLALTTHEGALYGVSKAGKLLPLYVFGPLAEAYAAYPPYGIAFAPDWQRYARNFVLEFLPFPDLSADQLPDDLEPKITVQTRSGHSGKQSNDDERPWNQTIYNGWPLYFTRSGPHLTGGANHPVMFLPATVDLPTPQDMTVNFSPEAARLMAQDETEDGGGPGLPGPYLGP